MKRHSTTLENAVVKALTRGKRIGLAGQEHNKYKCSNNDCHRASNYFDCNPAQDGIQVVAEREFKPPPGFLASWARVSKSSYQRTPTLSASLLVQSFRNQTGT